MVDLRYHPDPVIAAEVHQAAMETDIADIRAGYPPRRWRCDCGAEHSRGHFQALGVHRCMQCGYVGGGGTLYDQEERGEFPTGAERPPGFDCAAPTTGGRGRGR